MIADIYFKGQQLCFLMEAGFFLKQWGVVKW